MQHKGEEKYAIPPHGIFFDSGVEPKIQRKRGQILNVLKHNFKVSHKSIKKRHWKMALYFKG